MAAISKCNPVLAALLLSAISCVSSLEETDFATAGDVRIDAVIGEDSKTSLDGYKVLWSEGDAIGLFGQDDCAPAYFGLESGEGSSKGVFTGNAHITSGIAKYPFNASDRFTGSVLSTTLPSTQSYAGGSFESGVCPMAASVNEGMPLEFRPLCSAIRISISGQYTLTTIGLSANDGSAKLSGEAAISVGSGEPSLQMDSKASSDLTLNCPVTLSKTDYKEFIIVVPSQIYKGGITLTINSASGSIVKSTSSDLDLKAGRIYTVPPFEMILDGGITPSSYLFGEGTESSPFLIKSVEDLMCLRDAMNNKTTIQSASSGKNVKAPSAWYRLESDLDLSVCCGPEIGSWAPIGIDSNRFTGHFDGCGHRITGLYINNDATDGGLFGDIYTGGYLGNLDVTGNVHCNEASIICKGNYSTVENCIARGMVSSTYSAGGVLNMQSGNVSNCTNYADVTLTGTIYNSAGGICHCFLGSSGHRMENCVNYGDIRCEGGHGKAGGIAGYLQQFVYDSSVGTTAEVLNCRNYGDISGASHAGGITGEFYDCKVSNCANYGNVNVVRTDGYAGGICGMLRNPFSHSGSSVRNCLSTGNVSGNGTLAGICASNVFEISACYWLYDTGIGVSKGVIGGTSTNVVSLDTAQMKGEKASPSLLGNYKDPVKALNSWAFSNTSSSLPYQGWVYDTGGSSYPVLSGTEPQSPEGDTEFMTVSPASMTLSTLEQTVKCDAFSSSEVNVTAMPSWITMSEKTNDGNHWFISFTVAKNTSGSQRKGNISLSNNDGLTSEVEVTQRYAYYSDDYSRNGNVVTLQTHSEGNGIDLVFFGDAYTDKDISEGTYEKDIRRGVEAFFNAEPYATYRNMFDVKYVELVSATDTFEDGAETALSSYFGSGTLVGGDDKTVSDYCRTVTGKTSLEDVTAIVIVKAKRYAGTCYMYYNYTGDCGLGFSVCYFGLGTATSGQTSMECVLRHESGGHGFAKLADEYAYSSMGTIPSDKIAEHRKMQNYGWYPNVDFTSDPFSVKWTKFIQDDRYSAEKIGVYEGGATYFSGVYRPTENSIMRYNTGKFNAPSREAIYYKIHRLAYGSLWSYDYNAFIEYDAINRTSANSVEAVVSETVGDSGFTPLHPPVVIFGEP